MKKTLLTVGLLAFALLVQSCSKPEKRIVGTWKATTVTIDGKQKVTFGDQANDDLCGNISANLSLEIADLILTFTKDKNYQMNMRTLSNYTIDLNVCGDDRGSSDTTMAEEGTWEFVSKEKLMFKSKDGDVYECDVLELKKKSLRLKCPCVRDCEIDLLGDGDIDYTIGYWEGTFSKQ